MNAPTVTKAQIEAHLKDLQQSFTSDSPLVLLRGDADQAPSSVSLPGTAVDLLASDSPLEIRAKASEPRTAPLVVVTGCDSAALGDELVASSFRRRVINVDRWVTIAKMFGAETVTRSLAKSPEVADVLIEAQPANGYRPVASKILDLETALAATVRVALGADAGTLRSLLAWAETDQAAYAFRQLPDAVATQVGYYLSEERGPAIHWILAVLRQGKGADLMSLALAGGVAHAQGVEDPVAGTRIEDLLGRPDLPADAYLSIADAAERRVLQAGSAEPVARWLADADEFLRSNEGRADHSVSAVLPSGFEARLVLAAEAVEELAGRPTDSALSNEAERRIEFARQHREVRHFPQRVERLAMAARLIRAMAANLPDGGTLDEVVTNYIQQGAWFDEARVLVSQGDPDSKVAALCSDVTAKADAVADDRNRRLANVLNNAAHPPAGAVIGVESVLDRVVAPVAADLPTLVLVLDGMGWPTFLDVIDRFESEGWHPATRDSLPPHPAALAALPTVTELSRTSLLCGTLRKGDKDSEGRAFAAHSALAAVTGKERPPQLFHKTDLRKGGIDSLPSEVLDVVGDETFNVVGVVLNNIDERLKDVAAPPGGWDLDALTPLREILGAARRAGRAVIVTADHGHILERGTEHRQGGGGERWRATNTGAVGEGEISVAGPRVLTEGSEAILPWREQIRYAPLRNGYHGGLTPAEVIVPLVVLWPGGELLDGWSHRPIRPPEWWLVEAGEHASPAPTAPTPTRRPKKSKPQPDTAPLFDLPPVEEASAAEGTASDWEAAIVGHPTIAEQLAALRLDAETVSTMLRLMHSTGGTPVSEDRIADGAGVPRMRIGRTITQLQRLLNIDGYGIVETSNGEVRFDRQLLERQLGL